MVPLDALLCPCCTPALLHSLAQSYPALLSRQMLVLGTGALTAVMAQTELRQTKQHDLREAN
ncbi:hypothetical protein H6G45_16025 [Synechocystis sp. FACHB-383]|uniref:hypothetical protein n=1 Tax=Synechocystis sp. FACHB-383 TaxID=2692864 RepID=UPI001685ACC3|nr:hypothetical protein [Synechocystis sp. FACHB-383]MBD2654961.1 hypothetical protein [Synechocystis sp. FACHB-383]